MNRFEIYIANLNPTEGAEINKTRPVVIVSPDEMNNSLSTVIIAPITSKKHIKIPTRIPFTNDQNQVDYIAIDQLRTLDKSRLMNHIHTLTTDEADKVIYCLQEMFA